MRVAAVLAAALSCFLLAPHVAAQDDFETAVVNNAWANPAHCNLRIARRMSLAEAVRRDDADYGHCVAIPVYVGDLELFATRGKRALARSATGATGAGRIGFYARDSVREQALRHPRTRYWVVGQLSECRRAWPDAMVMGYCHYTAGPAPILIVAEMRPDR
jgi:hypothetical protein